MTASAMASETAEAPAVVQRLLASRGAIQAAARVVRGDAPLFAVVCGRGSSGHVGVLLRYLIETRLGLAVSTTAPSVITALHGTLQLQHAMFVVISQSGGSPDLVAATRAARAAGARTIAIVNVADSPVARAAELVIALNCGIERSVAATKSVISSMAACAELVAALADDQALRTALDQLPARLAAAHALDWRALAPDLARAPACFVTARGFGLGTAREIALKLAETLRLPSLAYSAAELLHGPRASVSSATPVLALRQSDATATAVNTLVTSLRAAAVPVHDCGGPHGSLPWIGDAHPVTDAIAMLMPAYRMIEAAARAAGFDPDHPPHLRKVTETL
jgi:glucosamine--fructose-6-phosphate aminotransferase (isomerizing)